MQKLTYLMDGNSLMSVENASDYVNSVTLVGNAPKSFTRPLASSKVLFSTNFAVGDSIYFAGVSLIAVASGATALTFVPGVSLAATLAALVIQFQALPQSPAGTYSVTDGGTSITFINTLNPVPVIAGANKATGTNTTTQVNGARFCRLSAGQLFYYALGYASAVAPADVSNGQGSISVPATVQPFFSVESQSTISVISPTNGVVSAEFWA